MADTICDLPGVNSGSKHDQYMSGFVWVTCEECVNALVLPSVEPCMGCLSSKRSFDRFNPADPDECEKVRKFLSEYSGDERQLCRCAKALGLECTPLLYRSIVFKVAEERRRTASEKRARRKSPRKR